MPGTLYPLEVNSEIPPRLARLEKLANDLWYHWNRPARELFARLSLDLWRATNHSPKAFLKRVDQHQLTAAAANRILQDGIPGARLSRTCLADASLRHGPDAVAVKLL